MITYAILIILTGLLNGIASPLTNLPDASLPATINAGVVAVGTYLGIAWEVAPLTVVALIAALAVVIIVENGDAIFKVVKSWLRRHLI